LPPESFEYWKYTYSNKLEKKLEGTFKVAPYAIVYNKQQFYLIGILEGKENFFHFRLDRIKNIEQLEEKRTIRKTSSEIREFEESSVEMFGGEKEEIEEIEVICPMFLLDSVIDEFGKNINIEKIDNENFKIIVNANPMGFKMWAMRNIDCVEVIKPVELRNQIKDIIENAKKRYK